jgi:CheY-like chemotaxis protein
MDHMMPGMDGIEAVKVIRELNPSVLPAEIPDLAWFKNMPIIALSANAVSGAKEAFLNAGMNGFISKPIDAETLNAALLRWLPPEKVTMRRQGKSGEWGTEYDALFKELKRLEFLNLTAGLSHVGNNETAYIKILRQFCAEFDGYVRDIERFFGEENWAEYTIRIHAIKGVFANMGAGALSRRAGALEYAARNGDYAKCLEETESFIGGMIELREKLLTTSLIDGGGKKEKRRTEAAELLRALEAAREACGQGMADEADALAETLRGMSYSKTVDAAVEELCGLVDSLDYGLAVEKAAAIKKTVAEGGG